MKGLEHLKSEVKLSPPEELYEPKSTRKRNTPENAGNRPFPESAFSGVLRFRVLFGALLEGNKEHPKTQHTRKRRFWEWSITCVFRVCCVFGCSLFSSDAALWFAIAAHLVRTSFSSVLQAFFPSKRGSRCSKYGGGSKNTTA